MEVDKDHLEIDENLETRFVYAMMLTPEMECSESDKV